MVSKNTLNDVNTVGAFSDGILDIVGVSEGSRKTGIPDVRAVLGDRRAAVRHEEDATDAETGGAGAGGRTAEVLALLGRVAGAVTGGASGSAAAADRARAAAAVVLELNDVEKRKH